jgi:hypothetical protein
MTEHVEIRWIRAGIVGGLCASILYPVLLLAPLPLPVTAAVASFLGPAIGLGSLGPPSTHQTRRPFRDRYPWCGE